MSEASISARGNNHDLDNPETSARAILESITDGFFALDKDWCFIYINPAAERLLGASREKLLGRNHWELYPSSIGTIGEQTYRRAVREQVPAEFEFFYQPWQRWYLIKVYPAAQKTLSVFFRDITEQKALFEEQRRQWLTFDAVLSSIPDHTYILDLKGKFIYANRALLDMWQKSPEDVSGRSLLEIGVEEPLVTTLEEHVQSVARTGQIVRQEAAFQDPDGKEQIFEYIFSPIFDSEEKVQAIAGSSRDIGERKRAERVLADRARLNALGAEVGSSLTQIEHLPQALQQCTEAMVRHLNATFARIWTLAPAENILELQASAGLYTHLNGGHARVPVGSLKIGLIAQERQPHLSNNVQADPRVGDQAWARREGIVAFAGYPMVVEDRLVGVLAMFSRQPLDNDTLNALASVADTIAIGIERKRGEEVLSRQADELARSNADLQQFAYITSHDLQEPLRTMSNFSQILMRRYGDMFDDDAREFLDYIVSGAQRMKILVDSLLSYSRVVNVETMPFAPVLLESALEWAMQNLQTVIEENKAEVTHDSLPTVMADQVQLVQLLQNLLNNAIKYRVPNRSPRIHISASRRDGEWVISVKDNGIGLEPEYYDRIFGVFKRLHGREIPGAGIGLAICKRIVEKHGGRIWVESIPGEGSSFLFTLPV